MNDESAERVEQPEGEEHIEPAPVEEEDIHFSVQDARERGQRVKQKVKLRILRPAYKFGQRVFDRAEDAVDGFFDGLTDSKRDGK